MSDYAWKNDSVSEIKKALESKGYYNKDKQIVAMNNFLGKTSAKDRLINEFIIPQRDTWREDQATKTINKIKSARTVEEVKELERTAERDEFITPQVREIVEERGTAIESKEFEDRIADISKDLDSNSEEVVRSARREIESISERATPKVRRSLESVVRSSQRRSEEQLKKINLRQQRARELTVADLKRIGIRSPGRLEEQFDLSESEAKEIFDRLKAQELEQRL